MPDDISRRVFLKVPAAATAGAAILKGAAPSDTLRVAHIGVGNRGSFLLQNGLQVPGLQVVAVCDLVEEKARRAAEEVAKTGGKAAVYTDYRRMLDQEKDLDAIILATPDNTHKTLDLAILATGKSLYAEKPLALNAADGKAIVAAARKARGIFQAGFQLRHDPRCNASERFIQQGGIGRILMCHGVRHGGDIPHELPWYFDRNLSGDIPVDQGIHILDLFTWAIGANPLRATAFGGINLFKNDPPGRTIMDGYSAIVEYPNGVFVNFSHHYYDPPGFSGIHEQVFGTDGAIELNRAVWQPRDKRGEIKLDVADPDKDSTYMSLAAFADNVRNHKTPLNNAESAYRSLMVPLMIVKSVQERRPVTWDEVDKG